MLNTKFKKLLFSLSLGILAIAVAEKPAPAQATVAVANVCQVSGSTTATSATLACTVSQGQIVIAEVLLHNGTAAITPPTGFTQFDSKSCNSANELVSYWYLVPAGDSGSYLFSWGPSTFYSHIDGWVISGSSTTAPVDSFASNCTAGGTSTYTTVTLTPTGGQTDLGLAAFGQSNNSSNPTAIGSGWTNDFQGITGAIYLNAQHDTPTSSGVSASVTYSSGPVSGIVSEIMLIAPAPAAPSTFQTLPSLGAGGPHLSQTQTLPTGSTSVYPYVPSYVYYGTATNGGGGGDCSGSPCMSSSMFSLLNIRYCESAATSGTWSCDNSVACNGNQNCLPIYYTTMNNMQCDASYETSIFNAINSLTNDVAFIHSGSPTTSSNRITHSTDTGVCSNGVYLNPAYITGTNNLVSDWNTYLLNGKPSYWLFRWDNSSLIDNTAEYGSTAHTSLVNYMNDYTKFLSQFSGHLMGANSFGNEGNFCNGTGCTGGSFQFACWDHVCSSISSWCTNNSKNTFAFTQSERTLIGHTYLNSSYFQRNSPYVLDTLAEMYNDTGCNAMDIVALNPVNSALNADSRFFRDQELALRILGTPGNYKGAKSDRAFVSQRYEDCTDSGQFSCNDQMGIYPEDGLQFIPKDSGMSKFTDGGANLGTGDGCYSGDSGGAKLFVTRCVGTNDLGGTGAIWARAGTCYKWGTSIGNCILIVNATNQDQTIAAADCHVGGLTDDCNTTNYPFFWHYNGTGPETCYEDLGTNVGTSTATCNAGDQICPAANGCQGAWGESATTGALPGNTPTVFATNGLAHCPGPLDDGGTGSTPTQTTKSCTVLLLKQ